MSVLGFDVPNTTVGTWYALVAKTIETLEFVFACCGLGLCVSEVEGWSNLSRGVSGATIATAQQSNVCRICARRYVRTRYQYIICHSRSGSVESNLATLDSKSDLHPRSQRC